PSHTHPLTHTHTHTQALLPNLIISTLCLPVIPLISSYSSLVSFVFITDPHHPLIFFLLLCPFPLCSSHILSIFPPSPLLYLFTSNPLFSSPLPSLLLSVPDRKS